MRLTLAILLVPALAQAGNADPRDGRPAVDPGVSFKHPVEADPRDGTPTVDPGVSFNHPVEADPRDGTPTVDPGMSMDWGMFAPFVDELDERRRG